MDLGLKYAKLDEINNFSEKNLRYINRFNKLSQKPRNFDPRTSFQIPGVRKAWRKPLKLVNPVFV